MSDALKNRAEKEFQEAKKDVEAKRSEVVNMIEVIDARIREASSAAKKTFGYLQKAEQVARQYPFVNAAVFVTAGFIFGSLIAKNDKKIENPAVE